MPYLKGTELRYDTDAIFTLLLISNFLLCKGTLFFLDYQLYGCKTAVCLWEILFRLSC